MGEGCESMGEGWVSMAELPEPIGTDMLAAATAAAEVECAVWGCCAEWGG